MFFKNNSNYKIILFLILAIFSVWMVIQIKEIAMLFFGSFVIACSLNPLVDKLSKKMNRACATTLVLLVVSVLLLLVLFPVGIKDTYFINTRRFKKFDNVDKFNSNYGLQVERFCFNGHYFCQFGNNCKQYFG